MSSSWSEEGTLADLKYRLAKIRVQQSRQKCLGDLGGKKDDVKTGINTLKLLQSKFGTPVYDPVSPVQRAYERSCARSGRRRSFSVEDLCLQDPSDLLLQPRLDSPVRRKISQGSAASPIGNASRNDSLFRSSSTLGFQSTRSLLYPPLSVQTGDASWTKRYRKISDPTSYRKREDPHDSNKYRTTTAKSEGGWRKVGQGELEGQKGQGKRGTVGSKESVEEKRRERKLVGVEAEEESHHVIPAQRLRKTSKIRTWAGISE
ncbi:hypothetical protein ACOMHN_019119 [Nucella lapillus]